MYIVHIYHMYIYIRETKIKFRQISHKLSMP